MSTGTNKERITQNTESIEEATTKVKNLKIATFQDKTITENGTYTADTDYSGLGTVTVNVEGGTSDYNTYRFNTVDEMNACTTMKDGDIAVIYNMTELDVSSGTVTATALILPETFTLTSSPNFTLSINEGGYIGFTSSDITVYYQPYYGGDQLSEPLYTISNNIATRIYTNDSANILLIPYFNSSHSASLGTTFTISNPTNEIWNYIKFANIDTIEVYSYDAIHKEWYTTAADMAMGGVYLGEDMKALGGKGLITGKFPVKSTPEFISLPSLYMMSSIPEDYCLYTFNIKNLTTKLGDRRYIGIMSTFDWGFYIIDNVDAIIKYACQKSPFTMATFSVTDDGTYIPMKNANYALSGNTYLHGYDTLAKTPMTAGDTTTGLSISYTSSIENQCYICTNMEIQDTDGNVLVEAGPKASTVLKGTYYINAFGEKVEGTYEPSITTTEYNTALSTTNKILGTEVTE